LNNTYPFGIHILKAEYTKYLPKLKQNAEFAVVREHSHTGHAIKARNSPVFKP